MLTSFVIFQSLNAFHASVPFLYLLKTSENQRFSDVFQRYRNGAFSVSIGSGHWVKKINLAQKIRSCTRLASFFETKFGSVQKFYFQEVFRYI